MDPKFAKFLTINFKLILWMLNFQASGLLLIRIACCIQACSVNSQGLKIQYKIHGIYIDITGKSYELAVSLNINTMFNFIHMTTHSQQLY